MRALARNLRIAARGESDSRTNPRGALAARRMLHVCAMRPLVLLVAMTVLATTRAASAEPLSVDALVREVIERNPSVRARVLRRDALANEARAAGIYPDPQIAVMVDRVPQAHDAEMPMVRYQATQTFPWPGKLPLMRTAVERQRDGSDARSTSASWTSDSMQSVHITH